MQASRLSAFANARLWRGEWCGKKTGGLGLAASVRQAVKTALAWPALNVYIWAIQGSYRESCSAPCLVQHYRSGALEVFEKSGNVSASMNNTATTILVVRAPGGSL